jgi:hypothetical protein
MRSFSDNLAAIGQPLQNHEFTAYLLSVLNTSYDATVTSISTQIDKMTSEDMFNYHLAFELQLEQQQIIVGSVNVATMNDYRSRDGKYLQPQRSPHNQTHGSHNKGRGVEIEVEMSHLNTTPPIKDHNAKSVENLVTPPFNGITGLIMPTKAPP